MYCGKCGFKIENNELYCGKCGAKIEYENQIDTIEEVVEEKKNPIILIDYLLLGLTIVALILSIIPINISLIIGCGVLGIASFALSIWCVLKKKNNLNIFCLIVASCVLIVVLGWVYYLIAA